jgi:hypothetical protein
MEIHATVLARQWYAALVAGAPRIELTAMADRWRREYGDATNALIGNAVRCLWAIECLDQGNITELEAKGYSVAQVQRMKHDAKKSTRQTH